MPANKSGKAGEDYAANWLKEHGYAVLHRNFFTRYGEIDIIARQGEYICFVEVKTRRAGAQVSGAQAVTKAKQRRIITSALLYLQQNPCDLQPRFDVCSVETDGAKTVVACDYLAGAFDGGAYG